MTYEQGNSSVVDQAIENVSRSAIGFVGFSDAPGAYSAGSGTLASVGSVRGILSAAHVVSALPESGSVGLVRFPPPGRPQPQRMQIEMAHCRKILIGSEPWSDTGPDLAFLTLPPDAINSLIAFGSVFVNLDRQRDVIVANAQTRPPAFRAVVGVVHERTRELEPHFEGTRLKGFNASFEVGDILREDRSGPHDLFVIEPQPDEGYEAPTSYEGVSGGGLWQFICEEHADGTSSFVRRDLIGVAFFQSPPLNGKRLITCHGPHAVYRELVAKVRAECEQ